jgi:polyketide biosynthesis enoyl-CoA hydratase PksH
VATAELTRLGLHATGACAWLDLAQARTLHRDSVATLTTALRAAEAAPGCRVLVLTASGPVFCAGLDLGIVAGELPWERADGTALGELLRGLRDSRLITVAAVEGQATGGGVGLAAACDLVFAGERARFRMTELLLGLTPALILPYVAQRTGRQWAYRAALYATGVDPVAAVAAGLADEAPAGEDGIRSAVRVLLRALRRAPRDVVTDLKTCRAQSEADADLAYDLLSAGLADPAVRERVAELRAAGM